MIKIGKLLLLLVVLSLLSACATTGGSQRKLTPPVALEKISQELPEAQLLDVWIELFDPGKLPEKEKDALGLSEEIRQAEARYMPVQLRGVMEKTGYWGAIRVVPYNTEGAEVLVRGKILESNGEQLELRITAEDASGKTWFKKIYKGLVDAQTYENLPETIDSFQMVYRMIANDLAKFRNKLTDQERIAIRQFANVRFAADMAPDAFAGHLQQNEKGIYQLNRLPAENDPAFQRVQIVRERDFLLIDTLNGHFDNYYLGMSSPYLEWRKARSYEAESLREIKKKANTRKALGAAAIIGAIAIEVMGGSNKTPRNNPNRWPESAEEAERQRREAEKEAERRRREAEKQRARDAMRDVLILGGTVAIKQGMDINAQSTIHQAAIEELGDSFSSEAEPMVVEVDGEVYKLTGSAEVQYQQWRVLMREIYAAETGFEIPEITEISVDS